MTMEGANGLVLSEAISISASILGESGTVSVPMTTASPLANGSITLTGTSTTLTGTLAPSPN